MRGCVVDEVRCVCVVSFLNGLCAGRTMNRPERRKRPVGAGNRRRRIFGRTILQQKNGSDPNQKKNSLIYAYAFRFYFLLSMFYDTNDTTD